MSLPAGFTLSCDPPVTATRTGPRLDLCWAWSAAPPGCPSARITYRLGGPARLLANAIRGPSGDHAGEVSSSGSGVTCQVAIPEPGPLPQPAAVGVHQVEAVDAGPVAGAASATATSWPSTSLGEMASPATMPRHGGTSCNGSGNKGDISSARAATSSFSASSVPRPAAPSCPGRNARFHPAPAWTAPSNSRPISPSPRPPRCPTLRAGSVDSATTPTHSIPAPSAARPRRTRTTTTRLGYLAGCLIVWNA